MRPTSVPRTEVCHGNMAKPPVPKTGASRALAVAICWYNFVVVWFGSVFVLFLGFRGGVGRGDVGSRIVVTAGVMLNALALCARVRLSFIYRYLHVSDIDKT